MTDQAVDTKPSTDEGDYIYPLEVEKDNTYLLDQPDPNGKWVGAPLSAGERVSGGSDVTGTDGNKWYPVSHNSTHGYLPASVVKLV